MLCSVQRRGVCLLTSQVCPEFSSRQLRWGVAAPRGDGYMLKISKLAALAAVAMMGLMWGAPAQAQATRTWISGVGDDANPCSRTAPCKTFAGAISKTAAGGEIDCLDPGGFGGVTVTKSITIDGAGTMGSILAAGTNGINVNDSATASPNSIIVNVRNLSIQGTGPTGASPGFNGIN